jgi:hypothetical protein
MGIQKLSLLALLSRRPLSNHHYTYDNNKQPHDTFLRSSTIIANMIHLLLPAPNGVFPYLTPTMAERYFGEFGSQGSNRLWLGVAVRDTCVVPSFVSRDDKNNISKSNNKPADDNGDNKNGKKPTGYSISFTTTSSSNRQDEAVLPAFTHVTVPSFDLLQDESDHQHQLLISNKQMKRNGNHKSAPSSGISSIESTNRHVMVWTPHGRQVLTPHQYYQVAHGLHSSYTLSLYDQCHDNATTKSTRRRQQLMKQRNANWLDHIMTTNHSNGDAATGETISVPTLPTASTTTTTRYIMPWVLLADDEPKAATTNHDDQNENGEDPKHDDAAAAAASDDPLSLTSMLQQKEHASLAGIALIGWPHVTMNQCYDHQRRPPELSTILTQVQQATRAISQQRGDDDDPLLLMVLEARSLTQVLNAMDLGIVNVIGTSLPTMWARQHMAWVLDFEHYHNNKCDDGNSKTERDAKRPRLNRSSENNNEQQHQPTTSVECNENGCWDMSQKLFQLDQRPLVENCTCFACRGSGAIPPSSTPASRAYLHHLVQTQELLGEMLLLAHNLHHMLKFFQYVSETILPAGEFSSFRQYLQDQLPKDCI